MHVLKNFKESNEENVKNNLKSDVSVLKVCLFIISSPFFTRSLCFNYGRALYIVWAFLSFVSVGA